MKCINPCPQFFFGGPRELDHKDYIDVFLEYNLVKKGFSIVYVPFFAIWKGKLVFPGAFLVWNEMPGSWKKEIGERIQVSNELHWKTCIQISSSSRQISPNIHIITSNYPVVTVQGCTLFAYFPRHIYIYINMFLLIFLLSLGSYDFVQNQGTPNCSDLVPRFSQLDNIFSERTHRMLYSTWCFFGFG